MLPEFFQNFWGAEKNITFRGDFEFPPATPQPHVNKVTNFFLTLDAQPPDDMSGQVSSKNIGRETPETGAPTKFFSPFL
jgi:hypothetical protein